MRERSQIGHIFLKIEKFFLFGSQKLNTNERINDWKFGDKKCL